MEIFCRICKIEAGEFFTLDTRIAIDDEKCKLLDIVNKCLHLDATLNDDLPQIVCSECLDTLKAFYPFLLKAIQTYEELREQLITNKLEELPDVVVINHNMKQDEVFSLEEYDSGDNTGYEHHREEYIFDAYDIYEADTNKDLEKCQGSQDCVNDANSAGSITSEELQYHLVNDDLTDGNRARHSSEFANVEDPINELARFECYDCGRKYSSQLKVEQHQLLHVVGELKKCKFCDAAFKSIFELNEHLKSHVEERKFICDICNKSFLYRASLKVHLLTHYNIRPFKCEVCGKSFQQKSILNTHMTLHNGKLIECQLCDRRFSRKAHLNMHMRQHYNIRPYQCSQCCNSYIQKSHLDRHIASEHEGVRFHCSVCGRSYSKQSTLNAHIRQEHADIIVTFMCELCNAECKTQRSLYNHMKSQHAEYSSGINKS